MKSTPFNSKTILLISILFFQIGCKQKPTAAEIPVEPGPIADTAKYSQYLSLLRQNEVKSETKPETEVIIPPPETTPPVANITNPFHENETIKSIFKRYADAQIDADFDLAVAEDLLTADELDAEKQKALISKVFSIIENKNVSTKNYTISERSKDVFNLYATNQLFKENLPPRIANEPSLANMSEEEKTIATPILYNLNLASTLLNRSINNQFEIYSSTSTDQKTYRTMILGRVDFSPGRKAKSKPVDADIQNMAITLTLWKTWLASASPKPTSLAKTISGHADYDKPANVDKNKKAGEERAQSVLSAILGIEELKTEFSDMLSTFTVQTLGDTYPWKSDKKDAKFNRRVEFVISHAEVVK